MEKINKLKKDKKIRLDETMVKKPKLKQFFFSYFPKIFQNFSVNAQCSSEIEGTPIQLKTS